MKKIIKNIKTNKVIKKKKKDKKPVFDKYGDKIEEGIDYNKDKPPHWQYHCINFYLMENVMNNQEGIKKLIRQGKEIGYILKETLNKSLRGLSMIDKQYIIETLEGMEIQIVDSPKEYDEYKYLSGEEAIKILQSLSDGNHEAFVKPPDEDND